MMTDRIADWLIMTQWYLSDAFYYRFVYYENDIDRLAFFEQLNYGWLQMYEDDEFWGRS